MKTTKTILSGEHAVSDKHRIALCIHHIETQNIEIRDLRSRVVLLEERVADIEQIKVAGPKKVSPKTKGVKSETAEATA